MTESESIPVLTLWQPWASLVALINPETGLPWKTIETRSWSTTFRGQMAIHAAVHPPCSYRTETWVGRWKAHRRIGDGGYDLTLYQSRRSELSDEPWRGALDMVELPLGAIVATCNLIDVAPIGEWNSFRTGLVEGDEGDLPGQPVVVNYGPMTRDTAWSLVLDQDGRQTNVTDQRPYGDFTPGRYAWLLEDVVPVDPPVPFRGGQGLTKRWAPPVPV